MFTHYGCITTRFFPAKAHGELSASDLESTSLKHLAPHVRKLLLPRGVRGMNEWGVDMLRGQGNDPHTQVVGSYFTCHPVTPNSDEPFTLAQDSFEVSRGKSVIDVVKADLETLERFDMSRSDKHKLEAWKALLHDTGGVVASAQCNEDVALSLGATGENLTALAGARGDVLASKLDGSHLDGADVYSNVAALAVVCNLNPILFLKYPAMYTFSALGLSYDSHTLSHRVASAGMTNCLSGVMDMLLAIDDFHSRKFAHLVGLLDGIQEGDGTVLDNCAAIWFQEMSDGSAHNLNNLPIVQAGSAGGYFKTGCAVNVDDGDPELTSGGSENACPGAQVPALGTPALTGTAPEFANAPINKYYCNLMNALGVRAGADGFPAVGGSVEVTHFGMYDRTEDFVGGGTNPPVIHDPGEFVALKANA